MCLHVAASLMNRGTDAFVLNHLFKECWQSENRPWKIGQCPFRSREQVDRLSSALKITL